MKALLLMYFAVVLPVCVSAGGRSVPLPLSVMPEAVAAGGEGPRYLWKGIQEGFLYKEVPAEYFPIDKAWRRFLHSEAAPIIKFYYEYVPTFL